MKKNESPDIRYEVVKNKYVYQDFFWRFYMTLFNKKIPKWYIDIAVYLGLLVSGIVFLYYVGTTFTDPIVNQIGKNSGQMASGLSLIAMITIYAYCMCTDKLQSLIFLFCAGMNFFVLLLNHNVFSSWLMAGVFFMIPILFRPTAELIKRDMQLFFLYAFMLCNMSLITNYTTLIQKEVSYNLEQSVYLEMVLAILGLVFFHYWDRLPEGVELTKISMVKLQRKFVTAMLSLIVLFGIILCGGNSWQELPEEGLRGFVKSVATTVMNELSAQSSLFFLCVQNCGVIISIGILFLLYKIVRRILWNYHPDKQLTNLFVLLSIVFTVEFMVWDMSVWAVAVYVIIMIVAMFIKEEKREIIITYGSINDEKDEETIITNDFDNITVVTADDASGVCE